MPQFPDWKQQVAMLTGAAEERRAQLAATVAEFAARAREMTAGAIPSNVHVLADRTRAQLEHLPATIAGEMRRRVNVLGLATREDVAAQSRLGRNRVSFVLKEFLDQQRVHDEALLATLRSELQEELQSFAAAIDDELFAARPATPAVDAGVPDRRGGLLDDDDDVELAGFDDGELDLTGGPPGGTFADE
jgi:hypothetical protein